VRIALDATYSVGDCLTGVGVYCRRILHGLACAHPDAEFYWCFRPHHWWRGLRLPVPRNCHRKLLWERWALRQAALFHGLNQRLPRARYRVQVATFHDLFVLTGEYSSPEFRQVFSQRARETTRRADLIIAVSRFTAGQVEDLLGVPASRIRVIYHGVDLPEPPPPPVEQREPIILHVGTVQKRKNLARLVHAFEQVRGDWRLVLVGSTGYGANEVLETIERSPKRALIELPGYLAQEELEQLYRRAAILAFPSLEEGFGLPVLEAMAHGLAVLTSNRAAPGEVAGSAALLVNPFDEEEIAWGLQRLTEDLALRRHLAAQGRQRAAQFSWQNAVDQTWKVYEELLG